MLCSSASKVMYTVTLLKDTSRSKCSGCDQGHGDVMPFMVVWTPSHCWRMCAHGWVRVTTTMLLTGWRCGHAVHGRVNTVTPLKDVCPRLGAHNHAADRCEMWRRCSWRLWTLWCCSKMSEHNHAVHRHVNSAALFVVKCTTHSPVNRNNFAHTCELWQWLQMLVHGDAAHRCGNMSCSQMWEYDAANRCVNMSCSQMHEHNFNT